MEAPCERRPEGLCASCRYLSGELYFYPVPPPAVRYACAAGNLNKVPNRQDCPDYEREPGTD
jgi:hypothetical protein